MRFCRNALVAAIFTSAFHCDANWYAADQTGDTNRDGQPSFTRIQGAAVRVPIRGKSTPGGGGLDCGDSTTAALHCVWFYSFGTLAIKAAYLSEASSATSNTMDATGPGIQLYFTGGLTNYTVTSPWVQAFTAVTNWIDENKSYFVTFLVADDFFASYATYWNESNATDPVPQGCYMIPSSSTPSAADAAAATWSSRGDVIVTSRLYAVGYMHTLGTHDGIPDLWWNTNFGNTTNRASADNDDDGMDNMEEYIADTFPKSSTSVFRITAAITNEDSSKTFMLNNTSSFRIYDLCWSTNLLESSTQWSHAGIHTPGGGTLLITVTNDLSSSFYIGSVRIP